MFRQNRLRKVKLIYKWGFNCTLTSFRALPPRQSVKMRSYFVGLVLFSVLSVVVRCGTFRNTLPIGGVHRHFFQEDEDDSFVFPSEPEDNQDSLVLLNVVSNNFICI